MGIPTRAEGIIGYRSRSSIIIKADELGVRVDVLNRRMDGLYRKSHTDMMTVLQKIDSMANDLRAQVSQMVEDLPVGIENK